MSENPQISTASKVAKRNKVKICTLCGKKETGNWAQHWTRQHPGAEKQEWDGESPLQSQGWCSNWKEVALNGAQPVGILLQFQKGFTSSTFQVVNAKRGSKSTINKPIAAPSWVGGDGGDVEMENTIQEEEQIAVPSFRQLENNQILGKRSPTVGQPQLEQAIERELHPDDSVSLAGPQSKRINSNLKVAAQALNQPRLTEQSLTKLPYSSIQQQQQVPKRDEFTVPDPVLMTVYRNQGMRDQEAICKLQELNLKKEGIVDVHIAKFIKLIPFFMQSAVSSFIEQEKLALTHIQDLLLHAQLTVDLNVEEISAIAVASVLFGGSCWASLPKAFNMLEPEKLT